MSVIFHPLRVHRVEPDTQEAVVVSFDVHDDLRAVFGFTQGQYLTLRADVDGQDLRRSYSICAGVDDGELRVGVRKKAPHQRRLLVAQAFLLQAGPDARAQQHR